MKRYLALLAVLGMVMAACSADDGGSDTTAQSGSDTTVNGVPDTTESDGSPETTIAGPSCDKDGLTLVTDGQLTIGTDDPAFPPWFDFDGGPSTGTGFESAVAYAVAGELGFSEDEVVWVVVPFNNSYAPGEKDFDFDINQISITAERDEVVDFSDGYYTVNQALLGFSDSEIAGVTTIDDLKGYVLGAQVGTTSLDFIEQVIQPDEDPLVFDSNADAKASFDAGQLDGLILDLPTAFYVSAVEIEGSAVIAQFPTGTDEGEEFGMLFEEGNPLRDCVNEALANIDLEAIQEEWLSEVVDAPVIETS